MFNSDKATIARLVNSAAFLLFTDLSIIDLNLSLSPFVVVFVEKNVVLTPAADLFASFVAFVSVKKEHEYRRRRRRTIIS